mmetsp:Transcript_14114/g.31313  ORF Transcript_14114/g.31313 Transcript_14114/m.31313 type:complete len:362 (-) Transcript_14114:107-1192(-)
MVQQPPAMRQLQLVNERVTTVRNAVSEVCQQFFASAEPGRIMTGNLRIWLNSMRRLDQVVQGVPVILCSASLEFVWKSFNDDASGTDFRRFDVRLTPEGWMVSRMHGPNSGSPSVETSVHAVTAESMGLDWRDLQGEQDEPRRGDPRRGDGGQVKEVIASESAATLMPSSPSKQLRQPLRDEHRGQRDGRSRAASSLERGGHEPSERLVITAGAEEERTTLGLTASDLQSARDRADSKDEPAAELRLRAERAERQVQQLSSQYSEELQRMREEVAKLREHTEAQAEAQEKLLSQFRALREERDSLLAEVQVVRGASDFSMPNVDEAVMPMVATVMGVLQNDASSFPYARSPNSFRHVSEPA